MADRNNNPKDINAPVAIQTEKGELVAFPDGTITPVKAKKAHKGMKDDVVTDILGGDAYIMSKSKDMEFSNKGPLADISFGYSPAQYEENKKGKSPKEIKFLDVINKKSFTPADFTKKLQSKFPVVEDVKSTFFELANRENKESRLPYLQILAMASEQKKATGTLRDILNNNIEEFEKGGSIMSEYGTEIITRAGDPYEYTTDGTNYYARKAGSNKWNTARGNAAAAIKDNVYGITETRTSSNAISAPNTPLQVPVNQPVAEIPVQRNQFSIEPIEIIATNPQNIEDQAPLNQPISQDVITGPIPKTIEQLENKQPALNKNIDNINGIRLEDVTTQDSISVRTNNPLNISDTSWGNVQGSENPIDGDAPISKFNTAEEGIAAFIAKTNYSLSGKSTVYPKDMTIDAYNRKFATSPTAARNFKSIAKNMYGVILEGNETLGEAIKALGGMENFVKVMAKKENHKLYAEMEAHGIYDKVTNDNYKDILNAGFDIENPVKKQLGGNVQPLFDYGISNMYNNMNKAITSMGFKDPMGNQDKALRNKGVYPSNLFTSGTSMNTSFGPKTFMSSSKNFNVPKASLGAIVAALGALGGGAGGAGAIASALPMVAGLANLPMQSMNYGMSKRNNKRAARSQNIANIGAGLFGLGAAGSLFSRGMKNPFSNLNLDGYNASIENTYGNAANQLNLSNLNALGNQYAQTSGILNNLSGNFSNAGQLSNATNQFLANSLNANSRLASQNAAGLSNLQLQRGQALSSSALLGAQDKQRVANMNVQRQDQYFGQGMNALSGALGAFGNIPVTRANRLLANNDLRTNTINSMMQGLSAGIQGSGNTLASAYGAGMFDKVRSNFNVGSNNAPVMNYVPGQLNLPSTMLPMQTGFGMNTGNAYFPQPVGDIPGYIPYTPFN